MKPQSLLAAAVFASSANGVSARRQMEALGRGDWREEVIRRAADNREPRVFTTTIPTRHRLRTLMHDPHYRLSVAWQNVGYNQPTQPGFHLGDGMNSPPRSDIVTRSLTR